jgi:hypothetical protein
MLEAARLTLARWKLVHAINEVFPMSDDKPDTTTQTGAEFQCHAGTDPAKWAEAFLAAYAKAEGLQTEADLLAFTTQWFRDYADACVAEAVRRTPWPSQQQPPSQ